MPAVVSSRAGSGAPKVAFVYPNPRRALAAEVAAGAAPDSALLGQNHVDVLGIDARIHEPALTRRGGGRLRWNLREVTLPWELGDADVAFTPLAGLFPLVARARRRPRVVVVNYGLCTIWDRSSAARRRVLGASLRSAAHVVALGEWQRERLGLFGRREQRGLPVRHVVVEDRPVGRDERPRHRERLEQRGQAAALGAVGVVLPPLRDDDARRGCVEVA